MTKSIKLISDNQEKKETYKTLVGRYNLAVEEGFYIEALMIDYAVLEDRFMSFFYYLDLLDKRNSSSISEDKGPIVLEIVEKYKKKGDRASLDLQSIETKITIVKCLILWASSTDESYPENDFLSGLKSKIEFLDPDEVLDVLCEIKGWKNYRNEVVHSLMNKNVYSLYSGLDEKAKEGMALARILDAQIKILKKKKQTK